MAVRTRNEWGAATPLGPRMALPVGTIFIHHSVTNPTSNPDADFRALDRIGKSRFGRFSYSWVVHPSGVGAEGAGLHVGAHTSGHNSTAFGICLIGNYENDQPTPEAVRTVVDIIRYLQAAGAVRSDVKVLAHRDVKQTACPGRNLYAVLPIIRNELASKPTLAPRPPITSAGPDLGAIRAAVTAATKHTLRTGSKGDAVKVLQQLLNNKLDGPDLVVDGNFGGTTNAAVARFQSNLRAFFRLSPAQMPVDGIVGPATWFWLTR
jgi:hypothetical protein